MTVALITGVSGQDGWYLSERLLASGGAVHGVVRPGHGGEEIVDGVVVHELDVTDADRLAELVLRLRPDHIYNLAAISSVFQSWQQPVATTAVNVLPIAALLEACLRLKEAEGKQVRLVQASSAEIFGSADEVPQSERTPIRPASPYGATKAFGQHLVEIYRRRGLFASTCILYNHESPRRPENFVTRKITAAAARIAAGRQETLELGGLDTRRDWGWAPDYAAAMQLAAEADEPDDFVIATGQDPLHRRLRRSRVRASRHPGLAGSRDRLRRVRPPGRPCRTGRGRLEGASSPGLTPSMTFTEVVEAMVDHDLALVAGTSDRDDA